jgi:hypothetical protein
MAERLKAVASKAIVRIADRGFESPSLRHSMRHACPELVEGLVAGHISIGVRHELSRASHCLHG